MTYNASKAIKIDIALPPHHSVIYGIVINPVLNDAIVQSLSLPFKRLSVTLVVGSIDCMLIKAALTMLVSYSMFFLL